MLFVVQRIMGFFILLALLGIGMCIAVFGSIALFGVIVLMVIAYYVAVIIGLIRYVLYDRGRRR